MVPFLLFLGAATAEGQASAERPGYGTTDATLWVIGYSEFSPSGGTPPTYSDFGDARWSTPSAGSFVATAHLPAGAQIVDLQLAYCDDSATDNVFAFFLECPTASGSCPQYSSLSSGDGPMGCNTVSIDVTSQNLFVDNAANRYVVQVLTQSGTMANRFFGVKFGYKLRVSPPPAVATFLDVPTSHPFFQFVEALFASGITAGCGGSNFCPDAPLTRGQMAVFLAAALGLHFPN
jgi:hypothetical protein